MQTSRVHHRSDDAHTTHRYLSVFDLAISSSNQFFEDKGDAKKSVTSSYRFGKNDDDDDDPGSLNLA